MATIEQVLQHFNVELSESDLAESLAAALGRVPGAASTAVTSSDQAYLATYGGAEIADQIDNWSAVKEHAQRIDSAVNQTLGALARTLSIEQAAASIGVDRSRISHRISAGQLYALTIGGRRRIPAWQIHHGHELPGLAAVIAAIEPGMHPSAIEGVMRTPQDELGDQTPITHLAAGGNAAVVAGLISELGRW